MNTLGYVRRINWVVGITALSLVVFMQAPVTDAQATYSYVGNAFNQFGGTAVCPPECNISGFFTTSSALGPNYNGSGSPSTFSFADGMTTITDANAASSAFLVITDAGGNITQWNLDFYQGSQYAFFTGTDPQGCTGCSVLDGSFHPPNSHPEAWAKVLKDPGTWTCSGDCDTPVNFKQVGPGVAKPGGVLHFNYSWQSSTDKLSDLSDCQVGEYVKYTGSTNPFSWPSPPYKASTPNPTVLWVPAIDGKAQDNHSHGSFLRPYVNNSFTARQNYRYRCSAGNPVNFSRWVGLPIVRQVVDTNGKGCFGYTITKSAAKASVLPLPGVAKSACSNPVADGRSAPSGARNANASRITVAVNPPEQQIAQNEPAFIDVAFQNTSTEEVHFDLGLNGKAHFRLELQQPDGRTVIKQLSSEGFGRIGEVSLASGESYSKRLLLSEFESFSMVGTYRVRIVLTNLFGDMVRTVVRPIPQEVAVEVGPRNTDSLRGVCERLADTALGAPEVAERMDAANALSLITDPVAIPYLSRVLGSGRLVENYAAMGLARIGNSEAVAALTYALTNPDVDIREAARRALDNEAQTPGAGPQD